MLFGRPRHPWRLCLGLWQQQGCTEEPPASGPSSGRGGGSIQPLEQVNTVYQAVLATEATPGPAEVPAHTADPVAGGYGTWQTDPRAQQHRPPPSDPAECAPPAEKQTSHEPSELRIAAAPGPVTYQDVGTEVALLFPFLGLLLARDEPLGLRTPSTLVAPARASRPPGGRRPTRPAWKAAPDKVANGLN